MREAPFCLYAAWVLIEIRHAGYSRLFPHWCKGCFGHVCAARAGAQSAGYVTLRLPHGVAALFEDWLRHRAPTKHAKILQRIRALRGGQLNDARFRVRMHGEGVFADHIAALFTLGCRKAGLQPRDLWLSTAAFRRPTGAQLSLFS
jgi:hypothetical protein